MQNPIQQCTNLEVLNCWLRVIPYVPVIHTDKDAIFVDIYEAIIAGRTHVGGVDLKKQNLTFQKGCREHNLLILNRLHRFVFVLFLCSHIQFVVFYFVLPTFRSDVHVAGKEAYWLGVQFSLNFPSNVFVTRHQLNSVLAQISLRRYASQQTQIYYNLLRENDNLDLQNL